MNSVCIEQCAQKRDTSGFSLKEEISLDDLPRFPLNGWQKEMTPAERQMIAGVYIAKVVDRLQGREQDAVWTRHTRPNPDGSRNSRISQTLEKQDMIDDAEGRNESLEGLVEEST